jgi:8-oxo-dGTP pyrophosphatase MutT (NUDIX family)
METLLTINLDDLSAVQGENLPKLRQAARAVVFDDDGKVAILHVREGDYCKLPGGGVEQGEDIQAAVERECLEETGCHIKTSEELGKVIEYRGKFGLKQESYCFTARVVGAKGTPEFTENEKANGFELLWLELDEAIGKIEHNDTEDYQGKFVVLRDAAILKAAKRLQDKP